MRKRSFLTFIWGITAAAVTYTAFVARAESPTTQPQYAPDRFIRFVEQTDGSATLETSIVRLRKGDTVVDLIGAIHIADQAYFDDLNLRFRDYDAVLYELVKSKDTRMLTPQEMSKQREGRGGSLGAVTMLQQWMQTKLGLSLQTDQIDYTPANFVHADLLFEEFAAMSEERGQELWGLLLRSFTMDVSDPALRQAAAAQPGVMDLVRAMQAPDRQTRLKRIFGKTMESADEMIDALFGSEGSVLIDARNERALTVLKEQMAMGKKKIAIFYGAGHMKKMEQVMLGEMAFTQEGTPTWVVAWQIDKPLPTTNPATNSPAK